MTRSKHDFAHINTGSWPKLEMIKQQINYINSHVPKESLTGYCIGLPGAGLQAERHCKEYRSYGIPDERQVMVDYSYMVHLSQKEYMEKLNYTGNIVCNDVSSVVRNHWANNKQVDIIDYDGVSHLEQEHENLIVDAAKHDVKVIILVITNRCSGLSWYHEKWKRELGLAKRYVSPSKGYREPLGAIQEGAIKKIAKDNGYSSWCVKYPGRDKGPPMLASVLIKQ